MIANYHTHTVRCNHAEGSDREYVEYAIKNGMKVLGFSDHCPWIYPSSYVSATRMLPSQLDDYFTSIDRLKCEYADEITIYAGFESEYIPELVEAQYKLLDGYPVDYMIMGQHFTYSEPDAPYTGWETKAEEDIIKYVDTIIMGMETGRYAYVAHPDLCNFRGDEAVYRREYGRLCAYLKEKNIPVEINMLGLMQGRHYPNDSFFKIAGETGCCAIIGCDAHCPQALDDKASMEKCRKYAEKFNLRLVDYITGLE